MQETAPKVQSLFFWPDIKQCRKNRSEKKPDMKKARWFPGGLFFVLSCVVRETYFSVKTQAANFLASASFTCALAGMGTGPHTPAPPLTILPASLSTASA